MPQQHFAGDWGALLDAMPQAVWLVDASELRIVAANAAAVRLNGGAGEQLIGRPVLDFAVTPEDQAFWAEAAAGPASPFESDTLVCRADGTPVPVARRVSPLRSATGAVLYLVALDDRSDAVRRERALELRVALLQATLDSLGDGILVIDPRGRIGNFNRRFAELWQLPDALLAEGDDRAVLDWMRLQVVDPARYLRRLAALDAVETRSASDVLTLHSGRRIGRTTMPQCSRGRPIGRLFTFREIDRPTERARG